MARVNRREVLSDSEIQVVHCVNRCVRRGYLCGSDPLTGKDYDHRRKWVRNRLEFLAGIFAVDVLAFAAMSNHLHVVLRNRPDVVVSWSDEEVARRWWNLFPRRRNKDGSPAEPAETDLNQLKGSVLELRLRLSSVSWFMRCTSEVIARLANAEDECTGRFWEGRFKAKVLPDEAAIAACMVYVDLNPIRAGKAETPEASDYTSIQERISDLKSAAAVTPSDAQDVRVEHGERAGWLAPVQLEPKRRKVRDRKTSRRASNRGCILLSLPEYVELVDWTGRALHPGKRGAIRPKVPRIVDRLGLDPELWLRAVGQFSKRRTPNRVTPAVRHRATAPSRVDCGEGGIRTV